MTARWLPAVVLAALALGSAWLMEQMDVDFDEGDTAFRHDPDYFMNDFVSVQMGEDGRPTEELRAVRLEHYPDTETHELDEPHMLIHGEDDTPTEIRSERGWVSADRDVILLGGRVYIWEDDADGTRRLEVLTRDLKIYSDEEYAETTETALIRTPSGESRSVGLRAWMADNRLELVSQVQTTYEPSKDD